MSPPDYLTAMVALQSGERITIRPMRPDDADRFTAYVLGLSADTRSRYGPHPFDAETARAICATLDPSDILRMAAFVRESAEERMIAYFLLKMGVLESDRERYADREVPLNGETDCTLAPSVADRYQDQGLGSQVMRHVLQCAARLSRSRVVLWGGVQASNRRAVHFYTKFGFRKVGEFFTDKDNDDMTLDLKADRAAGDGLDVAFYTADQCEEAAAVFHRDGFVCIRDALTPEQLRFAQEGADRVIAEQRETFGIEQMNRGFARHSFGDQLHHPEWAMLVDLPAILPVLEAIWKSEDFTCMGAGGDYSVPGAQIQRLHSDMGDFLRDPQGSVTAFDLPAPFIVVNYPMVAFTRENGAIRFVPGTQRSRAEIPTLDDEPSWMRRSILCAPAGAAIVRDVRCWHGGTANQSQNARPMTSVGYYAPWYRAREAEVLPLSLYESLPPRAQRLCRQLTAKRP